MRDTHPITIVAYMALGLILASLMGQMPGPVGEGIAQVAEWAREVMVSLVGRVI
jgi:hypothetical protein